MTKEIIESIPLIVYENEPGKYLVDIEVEVGEETERFLFDTGAAKTQIKLTEYTSRFEKVGEKESKGASGIGQNQDLITVPRLAFGSVVFENLTLGRGERGFFGIDLLKNRTFVIDLHNQTLSFVEEISNLKKIKWLKRGHLTIPVDISGNSTFCLFDTGANITVIDEKYVEENMDKFELVRTEEGEDANGNKIPSNIFNCKSFNIGTLQLENVEMAGFEYGDFLRKAMEGVPITLGNNVIKDAEWSFNFRESFWSNRSIL
jgi:predicted aspartyl protease